MPAMGALCGVAYSPIACGGRKSETVNCSPARQVSVVVDTGKHTMVLCDNAKPGPTFAVRIGKQGTGKSREGDGKTPLGSYALDEPRASTAFGLFVPIEYPTTEQRKLGFT